jgi:hypothetical protein
MTPRKAGAWKNWLLPAGLCLILVTGLVSLPGVGAYWDPFTFWTVEYGRMKEKLILEQIHQQKAEATLEALARGNQAGFPGLPPEAWPSAGGRQQAEERIRADRLYAMGRARLFKDMLLRWEKLRDTGADLAPFTSPSGSPGEKLGARQGP